MKLHTKLGKPIPSTEPQVLSTGTNNSTNKSGSGKSSGKGNSKKAGQSKITFVGMKINIGLILTYLKILNFTY